MADPVLVLRPEPGAARTAEALRAAGFLPILYPLYEIEPVEWTSPDPAGIAALLVTSANAVRQAGPGMARFLSKPLFAVGEATATAARQAGFHSVQVGGGDIASTVPVMVAAGLGPVLHLSGTEIRAFDPAGLSILRIPVYRSAPQGSAEGLAHAVPRDRGAFALVHSPRAGVRLAELVTQEERERITIVAISEAASEACGSGWRDRVVAGAPTGQAMLAGLQMLV
ncbi:MAG TPA: uroporphyrinogen-III synthase [Sphingobium sp.]|uniref:uroporphyrinogen-III synthase n=1 Tax=Sphingobium sp. TaxID=1912891 RepID=UPI002ED192CD